MSNPFLSLPSATRPFGERSPTESAVAYLIGGNKRLFFGGTLGTFLFEIWG
ncbi:MAG: hypothetical protein LBB88_05860 [Planctomycetaceae bacterium]|nr:hypothetical protein [Planctomycetaceae bacterium]